MRVLVIDDSPTVCKIIEVALGREGHQVVSFPDGIMAMREFTSPQIPLPELIFLDIDLPKINGYEIARHLRSKPAWDNTPIIMLSRHTGVVDRLKARLAGTQAFVAKPFKTQEIVEVTSTYARKPTESSTTN